MHRCRFENNHNESVIIKLVGAENQFNARLDPNEVVTAEGATSIVPGWRVVIAWNVSNDQIIDFRKINIDRDWNFLLQANGLFAIGAL